MPHPTKPTIPSSPSTTADPRRLALLGPLALYAAQLARFSDGRFTLDDAWISFRVSRNIVEHGVATFDQTLPPVEGMTNLLWTLLATSWVALWPDLDPALPARVVGAACGAGAVALAATGAGAIAAAAGADRRRESLAMLVAGLMLAGSGTVAFYAASGLETGLQLLLWAGAVRALTSARLPLLGVLVGFLAVGRPEGVLGGALLLGVAFLQHGPRDRNLWAAVGIFAAFVGAVEAFRLTVYGSLVPNTFHAKPPNSEAGLAYLGAYLWPGLGLLGPLAALPALRLRMPRMLLAVAVVLAAGAGWSGGDWMPGYRRLVEPTWVLALLCGVAAGTARGPALGLVGLGALSWLTGSGLMAARGTDSGRYGHVVYAQAGALLAQTPGVETVAAIDIGRLGWTFPGSIFDLAGLTDARLARAGGWDPDWFDARSPDVALVVAAEAVGPDLAAPASMRAFEAPMLAHLRSTGGYHPRSAFPLPGGMAMTVLVRDDLELPESIWGPPPPPGEAPSVR